ncbi:hypothetical protein Vadar_023050 [Vaccinium darrowii]|uniref:Uncharacterized protein n=1 Tax=Vaccinium darrowii TaxID=229202 RepID=A0ACB7YR45_9ERIC|nr:hypothetical protein Vadar_023050 [Vaccinium darrowii]
MSLHLFMGSYLLLRTEARLLFEAFGLKDMEVELDNKEAIQLIASVSELVPPWSISALVLDIRKPGRSNKVVFNWVPRSANKAAHSVAALALRGNLPCNWVSIHPSSLFSIFSSEFVL